MLDMCDEKYCENGGSCYWAFAEQKCFCATGYTGETCSDFSEELDDACINLVCGEEGNGECFVNSDGDGECACSDGYSGDYCTDPIPGCTAVQYMNLVQQLLLSYPEYTDDCTYMTTQIWEMIPIEDDYPVLCRCLSAMQQYLPDEYAALDCTIDQGLTIEGAVETYCTASCTQDTIDEMLTSLSAQNDDCYQYVQNGDRMPPYMQTEYQCSCLLGVAETYTEALDVLSCPLTLTSTSTAASVWEDCNDGFVCNYEDMYSIIQKELFYIDAVAAKDCMDFVELISFTEVISPDNNTLYDIVSPCLEGIYTKWPEGLETFNCKPLTHYTSTVKEIMETVYYDSRFTQPSCTYSFANSVFSLAMVDFSGAAMCLQAAVLGDQIAQINDNFDVLFCGCYDRLADIDDFDAHFMDECAVAIDWVVSNPQSYCEEYTGKTYDFLTDDDGEIFSEVSFASTVSGESLWTVVGVICTCVMVVLFALNIWLILTTKKSTSYEDFDEGTMMTEQIR